MFWLYPGLLVERKAFRICVKRGDTEHIPRGKLYSSQLAAETTPGVDPRRVLEALDAIQEGLVTEVHMTEPAVILTGPEAILTLLSGKRPIFVERQKLPILVQSAHTEHLVVSSARRPRKIRKLRDPWRDSCMYHESVMLGNLMIQNRLLQEHDICAGEVLGHLSEFVSPRDRVDPSFQGDSMLMAPKALMFFLVVPLDEHHRTTLGKFAGSAHDPGGVGALVQ